jgi:3-deoxy-7-phosphoheptulonate synthase
MSSGQERALAAPREQRTVVPLGDTGVGGGQFAVFAGPTRAAGRQESIEIGKAFAAAGAALLHNGTTSQDDPDDRPTGAEISVLAELREQTGLPVAAPITDIADVEKVGDTADVLQLAGYHMQNYRLLKELGQLDRPVILRRGTANTVDELVSAAEYVLVEGNPNVILCEHGIRTFERLYELTVDFAAVPLLKERTHLPIVVDPSVAGRTNVVGSLALGAAAAGADGIILEAEPQELDAYLDVVGRAIAYAATLRGSRS